MEGMPRAPRCVSRRVFATEISRRTNGIPDPYTLDGYGSLFCQSCLHRVSTTTKQTEVGASPPEASRCIRHL
jgi:hypothetical protein